MAKKKSRKSGKAKPPSTETAATAEAETAAPKKKTSPAKFFQEVRAEGRKVTWTSRNETMVSTIMVMIMVVIMALFFFSVDFLIQILMQFVLSLPERFS